MLKRFSSQSLSFLALLVLPLAVMAQGKADFKKPMEVESSHEQFDIKNNKLVLTDNVIIRQGTLLIKADRLEASASESGEQADTFIAEGSPATYTQTLENGNEISAQANKITYFQTEQRLELSGDAKISQGTSSSSGDTIVYDRNSNTALTNLTDGSTYYVIYVGTNTFKVATTSANATAGTAITLTATGGSETHKFQKHTVNNQRCKWSGLNDSSTWSPSQTSQSGYQDIVGSHGNVQAIVGGEWCGGSC